MNLLNLSTSATDLNAAVAPFPPNNTILAVSAAGATVQESDSEGSGYTTLAVLVANVFQKLTPTKQYIKVAAGSAQLIGN